MYFLTYFIVLVGLMSFISLCILGIIFLFDVPSLQEVPALLTLGGLLMLYCPSSILFSTCLSYIFDKMDSAQSILPNIATFFGLIPFILVMILDMLGLGEYCYSLSFSLSLSVWEALKKYFKERWYSSRGHGGFCSPRSFFTTQYDVHTVRRCLLRRSCASDVLDQCRLSPSHNVRLLHLGDHRYGAQCSHTLPPMVFRSAHSGH